MTRRLTDSDYETLLLLTLDDMRTRRRRANLLCCHYEVMLHHQPCTDGDPNGLLSNKPARASYECVNRTTEQLNSVNDPRTELQAGSGARA